MDREEVRTEGECDQDKGDDTKQTEIPRIRILERQRGVESQTSPRFGEEISKSTEAINQKESVSEYDGTYSTTELGDTRMDKLLSNRKHENSADQNRWMVANANANHHMETMEGESKANVGTAEAGSTRMDGQEDGRIRRPLSGRSKDNRITSNHKRNPRKARTHQLCRLLFEWNRRMPNGTYGGVRGARN